VPRLMKNPRRSREKAALFGDTFSASD